VDEQDRERMIRIDPKSCEKLGWGKKAVGLRINLDHAARDDVQALLHAAWQRKLPKRA
jgi:hypothetical protein